MYLKTGFHREVGKSAFVNFNINKLYISSGLKLSGTRINSPNRILPQAVPEAN